jgi:hypothetical protein
MDLYVDKDCIHFTEQCPMADSYKYGNETSMSQKAVIFWLAITASKRTLPYGVRQLWNTDDVTGS